MLANPGQCLFLSLLLAGKTGPVPLTPDLMETEQKYQAPL